MTWNYRIVKYSKRKNAEDWYGIHEVYYDNDGNPMGMTVEPVSFGGETSEGVIEALEMALKDAKEHSIFEEPENWTKE